MDWLPENGGEVNSDGRVVTIFFNAAKTEQVLIFVCRDLSHVRTIIYQ